MFNGSVRIYEIHLKKFQKLTNFEGDTIFSTQMLFNASVYKSVKTSNYKQVFS